MYIFIWNRRANIFLLSFSIFFLSSTITTLSSIKALMPRENKNSGGERNIKFLVLNYLIFHTSSVWELKESETRSKREWSKLRVWLASCCKHFSRYYVTTNIRRLCESKKNKKTHNRNEFVAQQISFFLEMIHMITFITAALVHFSNFSLREVTTNVNERQIINIYVRCKKGFDNLWGNDLLVLYYSGWR